MQFFLSLFFSSDRLELPFAEAAAFGDHANQREIIETCTDEEDLRWRELHKQRVAEHKKREAVSTDPPPPFLPFLEHLSMTL